MNVDILNFAISTLLVSTAVTIVLIIKSKNYFDTIEIIFVIMLSVIIGVFIGISCLLIYIVQQLLCV